MTEQAVRAHDTSTIGDGTCIYWVFIAYVIDIRMRQR